MAPVFEPVECFVVTDVSDYWREDESLPYPDHYNVGAIRDKRGSDGQGQFWVVTPMGPVDLNNPKMRWELTGTAPRITASPSIKVGPVEMGPVGRTPGIYCWHGWLKDGVLTGSWEAYP